MYQILAWLPGTISFVATHGNETGLLTNSGFEPHGNHILDAALHKYGFVKLTNPVQANSAEPQELERILQVLNRATPPLGA